MPDMDLEPTSDLFPDVYAWYAVQSYLRWPSLEEAEKRDTFMLRAVANALGAVDAIERAGPPNGHDGECFGAAANIVRGDLFANYFNPLGGFGKLGNVPDLDEQTVRDWTMVAEALAVIRSIDVHHRDLRGGAGRKKAAFIVVECLKAHGIKANDSYFDEAWDRYKGVAHLCVALHWLISRGKKFDMLGLGMFLAVARDYQDFAASFCPSGQKKGAEQPLVPSAIMWRVPAWREIPELSHEMRSALVRPLPAPVLDVARSYRAPA